MNTIMMENNRGFQFTAFHLRIIAIVSMFIDHIAVFSNHLILFSAIGRLAFPIFAFQIAEGYAHTKNFNKYCKKLLFFAIISEIPFNFLSPFGGIISPFYQNVLWTFLIALFIIRLIDKFKSNTQNKILLVLKVVLICAFGYYLGNITGVDYHGAGVMTVVMFYLTRNCKYKHIIQFIIYLILNLSLKGIQIYVNFFGFQFAFAIQLLALISLIPIWLYKGKQGYHSKMWTSFCYWFYPVHMMLLFLSSYII